MSRRSFPTEPSLGQHVSPGKAAAIVGTSLAVGLAGVAAHAALSAQSQLFGRTMVTPPLANQVALTFDDGPNPSATPQLLEVLARHHVRATFFLIGDFVLRQPELARQIAAAGHVIGNHTMTHRRLLLLSSQSIREELTACNHAIEDTVGCAVHFFRPPFGSRRPAVMQIASELELETVMWNVMVGDWKPVSTLALRERLERGMAHNRSLGRGSNLVLHDGGHQGLGRPRLTTVHAVDAFLSKVSHEIAFVTPAGRPNPGVQAMDLLSSR